MSLASVQIFVPCDFGGFANFKLFQMTFSHNCADKISNQIGFGTVQLLLFNVQ